MLTAQTCYICNSVSEFFYQSLTETKSKHSNTRICDIIRKFMDEKNDDSMTFDGINSDEDGVCVECMGRIEEYDLAYVTAENIESEFRAKLSRKKAIKTESTAEKESNETDVNNSHRNNTKMVSFLFLKNGK